MFEFDEKTLKEIPVVVIDTETTGLHPGLGHRIFEVGAIRYENGRRVAEFQSLVDPERPIDPQASKVTGMTDEDVVGAPKFADIRPELDSFLEGALLVAHNAPFDANFLGLEYSLSTPNVEPHKLILPNPWLCTLRLVRNHFHLGRNGLANVAQQFGVPVTRSHRALNDVITTAEVLWRMTRQLEERFNFKTVGDLIHAQGEMIYAPPPFDVNLPPILEEAIAHQQDVEILYLGKNKAESERIISPKYATHHRGTAYITAFCHLRQEIRTFRVDRIFSAKLVG